MKAPPNIVLPAVPSTTVAPPREARTLLPRKEELAITARLEPAFALASTTDPSIAAENPSLARLLKVRSAIAKRGAATRATNKTKEAKGEPAHAGGIGKTRKKRDEKGE